MKHEEAKCQKPVILWCQSDDDATWLETHCLHSEHYGAIFRYWWYSSRSSHAQVINILNITPVQRYCDVWVMCCDISGWRNVPCLCWRRSHDPACNIRNVTRWHDGVWRVTRGRDGAWPQHCTSLWDQGKILSHVTFDVTIIILRVKCFG